MAISGIQNISLGQKPVVQNAGRIAKSALIGGAIGAGWSFIDTFVPLMIAHKEPLKDSIKSFGGFTGTLKHIDFAKNTLIFGGIFAAFTAIQCIFGKKNPQPQNIQKPSNVFYA